MQIPHPTFSRQDTDNYGSAYIGGETDTKQPYHPQTQIFSEFMDPDNKTVK